MENMFSTSGEKETDEVSLNILHVSLLFIYYFNNANPRVLLEIILINGNYFI